MEIIAWSIIIGFLLIMTYMLIKTIGLKYSLLTYLIAGILVWALKIIKPL